MMKDHPYYSWLQYEGRFIVADHANSPDLAEKGSGEVVIVPRESHDGRHDLVLMDDSYWVEEDEKQGKVIAFDHRGHEVAVAVRD